MSILNLPVELTDYIIGFFHDDIQSLTACRLTCRSWAPAAESHIFHKLELHPSKLERFLGFLDSHSPHIALYVRILDIGNCSLYSSDVSVDLLRRLAPRLPKVEVLRITSLDLLSKPHPPIKAILMDSSNFPDLRYLHVIGSVFDSFRTLRDLVLAHPHLTGLGLSYSTCEGAGFNALTRFYAPRTPPSVPSDSTSLLALDRVDCLGTNPSIVYALLVHYTTRAPHTLRIHPLITGEIKLVSDLLEKLGTAVQVLAIGIEETFESVPQVSLTSNTQLRHLTIAEIDMGYEPQNVLNLLSTVVSPVIETVIFEASDTSNRGVFVKTVAKFCWSGIDATLTQSKFPKLRKVVIKLRASDENVDMVKVEKKVRKSMPKLEEWGVLEFVDLFGFPDLE